MAVYAGMQCTVVAVSPAVTGMKAMFSQVKSSGQSCSISDELWFLTHCCDSSSECLNKADACAVMNDCNQFNFSFFSFLPKSTAKLCLAKVCVSVRLLSNISYTAALQKKKYIENISTWASCDSAYVCGRPTDLICLSETDHPHTLVGILHNMGFRQRILR